MRFFRLRLLTAKGLNRGSAERDMDEFPETDGVGYMGR